MQKSRIYLTDRIVLNTIQVLLELFVEISMWKYYNTYSAMQRKSHLWKSLQLRVDVLLFEHHAVVEVS